MKFQGFFKHVSQNKRRFAVVTGIVFIFVASTALLIEDSIKSESWNARAIMDDDEEPIFKRKSNRKDE